MEKALLTNLSKKAAASRCSLLLILLFLISPLQADTPENPSPSSWKRVTLLVGIATIAIVTAILVGTHVDE